MHPLAKLAKLAIETYLKEGKIIEVPKDFPEEFLKRRAGVFVTLEKNGKLRGCIGTYLPTRINVAEETIRNAIAAATQDWRFESVKLEELKEISVSVSVLSYPEEVKDLKELDPKKYGVIVKNFPLAFPNQDWILDGILDEEIIPKTGVLLPDIEGVETVEQQISIACQKAGIDPQKEKIFVYKFTVEKYE
jgi:AmmeMemoRadiSam system protein A